MDSDPRAAYFRCVVCINHHIARDVHYSSAVCQMHGVLQVGYIISTLHVILYDYV